MSKHSFLAFILGVHGLADIGAAGPWQAVGWRGAKIGALLPADARATSQPGHVCGRRLQTAPRVAKPHLAAGLATSLLAGLLLS